MPVSFIAYMLSFSLFDNLGVCFIVLHEMEHQERIWKRKY